MILNCSIYDSEPPTCKKVKLQLDANDFFYVTKCYICTMYMLDDIKFKTNPNFVSDNL